MEAFLLGGSEQPFSQYLLACVLGQLEVVYAGVDRREARVVPVHLAYDREAWVEVGQTTRGQAATAGRELQEGFTLVRVQVRQHVHQPHKHSTVNTHRSYENVAVNIHKGSQISVSKCFFPI